MHKMKALPVRRLSAILELVANELRDRFGLTKLAIGGGSAPALLDHLFTGSALRMRDFDLVLAADRPVGQELARTIGMALDSPDMRFLPRYVYPRRRSRNPDEPLWEAGWGVLWDVNGMEVDLSIFHDESALELNGLMNVDRMLIPLPPGMTLKEIAARMLTAGCGPCSLDTGLIYDPSGGYLAWTQRSPSIVAWNAIHASPIECAIRIIRTCVNKLHITKLNADLADPLRAAILLGWDRGDRFIRVRTIVKLLHDDHAGVELDLMNELGCFVNWLPELGDLVERLGQGGLTTLFAKADRAGRHDLNHHAAFAHAGEQGGDETSALRLEAMLLKLPPTKREAVLEEIAIAEPTFASLVRKQLPLVARRKGRTPHPTTAPARQAKRA